MARLIDVISRGTRAAQPTAPSLPNGALYFVTDEDLIEQVVSAAWALYCNVSGSAGTPGGSDKNVQYNNAGAFGGIANNATATNKFLRQVSSGTPTIEQVSGADLLDATVSAAKLVDTAVTPGTYGDATHVGSFTVDQEGRLTAASNITITGGGSGILVSRAYDDYATNADLTTQIPIDDTIPQNTEGAEILSAVITPTTTTNRIRARFQGEFAVNDATARNFVGAIFTSQTADALAATYVTSNGQNRATLLNIEVEFVPATTSAVTISVRVGPGSAHTWRANGSSAARFFGGVSHCTLVLDELAA